MTTLFARVLGAEKFGVLAERVRGLHEATQQRVYHGCADIERGRGWLAGFCCRCAALPPTTTQQTVSVEIAPSASGECWTRRFGSHVMRSDLDDIDGCLRERLGLLEFHFALDAADGVLTWRVIRVRALGFLPLPAAWFSGVRASEAQRDGRYTFDVRAALPVVGLLVHYRGWLDVEQT